MSRARKTSLAEKLSVKSDAAEEPRAFSELFGTHPPRLCANEACRKEWAGPAAGWDTTRIWDPLEPRKTVAMLCTCSAACREKLGLPERVPGIVVGVAA